LEDVKVNGCLNVMLSAGFRYPDGG
jgi:hypothetical protein